MNTNTSVKNSNMIYILAIQKIVNTRFNIFEIFLKNFIHPYTNFKLHFNIRLSIYMKKLEITNHSQKRFYTAKYDVLWTL